jgi:hypothetical protein
MAQVVQCQPSPEFKPQNCQKNQIIQCLIVIKTENSLNCSSDDCYIGKYLGPLEEKIKRT